jgi:hypothetical protein
LHYLLWVLLESIPYGRISSDGGDYMKKGSGKLDVTARTQGFDLRSELVRLYWDEKKSYTEIGKIFNTDRMTVYSKFKELGIPARTKEEGMKLCDNSGSNNPQYGKQWSDERKKEHAEKIKMAIARNGGHWSKGRKMSPEAVAKRRGRHAGSKNGRWKGGKTIKEGYVMVYAPGHPSAVHNHVYEHRLVMEKSLGRLLRSDEHVHHINGDKQDNRLENLLLMDAIEHLQHHAHPES